MQTPNLYPRRNMLSSSLAAASIMLSSTAGQAQTSASPAQTNLTAVVKLIITFETKPDAVTAFTTLLEQVRQDLPKVAGCKGVRVFLGKDNPRVFTLVEDWESESAHKAHINQVIASGAWEKHIAIHLTKPPVSYYYTELIA